MSVNLGQIEKEPVPNVVKWRKIKNGAKIAAERKRARFGSGRMKFIMQPDPSLPPFFLTPLIQ